MLGVIRFLLSFSVIAYHLTAYIPNLGLLAVNFFYVISGFLITLVLHESYNFKFSPFAKNRFLRLYPAYFALAGLSLLFSTTLESYALFHPSWAGPASMGDTTGNLFIFPWAFLSDDIIPMNIFGVHALDSITPRFRLIPSTWSVGVEIVCYFLLWAFTARNLTTTALTIAASIGWHVYVISEGLNLGFTYCPPPAAMLPFGLGALAFHLSKRISIPTLSGRAGIAATVLICAAFLINWAASLNNPFFGSIYYYANTAIAFFSVIAINRTRHAGKLGIVDKWMGDLAYPMFLGQYVFGFVAWRFLGMSTAPVRGTELFLLGATLTIAASIAIVLVIDRKINKVRSRVRTSA